MGLDDYEQVQFTSRAELRAWLSENADRDTGIWLVTVRSADGSTALSYEDIVCEGLCFGWIDSTVRKYDDDRYGQLFTPRKPTSTWAATNKRRVEQLIAQGLMTDRGLAVIEVAKANGSWTILEAVERLEVPDDLAAALDAAGARATWDGFPPGARKQMLWQVVSAKRPPTRAARVEKITSEAAAGRRAWG